jgi:hypothetical protein
MRTRNGDDASGGEDARPLLPEIQKLSGDITKRFRSHQIRQQRRQMLVFRVLQT